MDSAFDPGALLAHSYQLPRGPRVRLRVPRPGDVDVVRDLYGRQGAPATEIGLARLLRGDPRRRVVICATALVDGRERVVGIGAIGLQSGSEPEPVVVDEELTEGLDELLRSALLGRARAISSARAA